MEYAGAFPGDLSGPLHGRLTLTGSDNFNALAAYELRQELGHDHVYRLARESELLDLEPAYAEGQELFDSELTFTELTRRFEAGADIAQSGPDGDPTTNGGRSERSILLFTVSATGRLRVATAGARTSTSEGDTTIWLTSGSADRRNDPPARGK